MPYDEFVGWYKYLAVRPEGWRDDMRAYMIMSSFGEMKKKPEEIFGSLRAVFKHERKNQPKVVEGALPDGRMLEMLLRSKKGNNDFDLAGMLGISNGD